MDISGIIEGIEIADALWVCCGSLFITLVSELLPHVNTVKANSCC